MSSQSSNDAGLPLYGPVPPNDTELRKGVWLAWWATISQPYRPVPPILVNCENLTEGGLPGPNLEMDEASRSATRRKLARHRLLWAEREAFLRVLNQVRPELLCNQRNIVFPVYQTGGDWGPLLQRLWKADRIVAGWIKHVSLANLRYWNVNGVPESLTWSVRLASTDPLLASWNVLGIPIPDDLHTDAVLDWGGEIRAFGDGIQETAWMSPEEKCAHDTARQRAYDDLTGGSTSLFEAWKAWLHGMSSASHPHWMRIAECMVRRHYEEPLTSRTELAKDLDTAATTARDWMDRLADRLTFPPVAPGDAQLHAEKRKVGRPPNSSDRPDCDRQRRKKRRRH